jgi:ABC-2 type transport system ATP-binding protein
MFWGMTDESPILRCRNVSKRYGRSTVLSGIDLDLAPGEVFGLLGPNGAGKTTLIKVLLGLVRPSSGAVSIFGRPLPGARKAVMRQVGAVVETPAFFEFMSAFENLRHLVALSGGVSRQRLLDALDGVGLASAAHRKVRTFSHGMKQRLGIAQALLPDTRFLILDEPTNGLDPHGIAGVRELVRDLARSRGKTVLVSSHVLTEVEQVCDRVMILSHGRTVLLADVDTLKRRAGMVWLEVGQADLALPAVSGLKIIEQRADAERGAVALLVDPVGRAVPALVRDLVQAGAAIHRVESRVTTLEDVFIANTQADESDVRTDTFRNR